MAAPLVTPAELSDHMQMPVPDATARLAVTGASGAVRAWCRWNVSREDTTLTAVGNGSTLLTLPTLHLVAVSKVRIDGLALDPAGMQPGVLLHGELIYADTWPAGAQVQVDVTHGFLPTPDVVRLVALTLAARIVNNPDSFKSATVGTVTRNYDPGLAALDERLLAPYRLE